MTVSGDDGADALHEVGDRLAAVHRRRRVVRVVEEDEAGPLGCRRHRVEVEPERRINFDLGDRMTELPRRSPGSSRTMAKRSPGRVSAT